MIANTVLKRMASFRFKRMFATAWNRLDLCAVRREALILGDGNVADLLLDFNERRCHALCLGTRSSLP